MRVLFPVLCAVVCLIGAACDQRPATLATPPAATAKPVIPGPDPATLTDSTAPAALLAYGQQYPASEVLVTTRLGRIRLRLFDDTPIHKANFLLLARKGVLSESAFNRVEKEFAVQGGRPLEQRTVRLGHYRLPPEFRPAHFHHKGALSMARYDDEQNPGKLSSNIDFFIALGEPLTLAQGAASAGRPLTPAQTATYAKTGGTPGLDGQYTVFGEVVEGLDVVDRIAREPVDAYKWPLKDIALRVEVVEK